MFDPKANMRIHFSILMMTRLQRCQKNCTVYMHQDDGRRLFFVHLRESRRRCQGFHALLRVVQYLYIIPCNGISRTCGEILTNSQLLSIIRPIGACAKINARHVRSAYTTQSDCQQNITDALSGVLFSSHENWPVESVFN